MNQSFMELEKGTELFIRFNNGCNFSKTKLEILNVSSEIESSEPSGNSKQ